MSGKKWIIPASASLIVIQFLYMVGTTVQQVALSLVSIWFKQTFWDHKLERCLVKQLISGWIKLVIQTWC